MEDGHGHDHDLERLTEALGSSLAEDKRPVGFFLGAGCPASIIVDKGDGDEPLIPPVDLLTAKVLTTLREGETAKSLQTLLAGLEADGSADPDIEEVLTRVRSLRAVSGVDKVRGLDNDELESLETALTDEILKIVSVSLPVDATPYHALASWSGGISRAYPITIFTTNYDLLQEQALEDRGVPFFDGFVGAREPFLDVYAMEEDSIPPRWARVWKLHGSVNWLARPDGRVTRSGLEQSDGRRLIHPSHLKYEESRRMPYLAMLDRLRAFLKMSSATLVLIGYSFRDDHINELVAQGLRGNASAIAFGLLHGTADEYEQAMKLASRIPNLVIASRDKACIGTVIREWKPLDSDGSPVSHLGDFSHFTQILGSQVGFESSSGDKNDA